MPSRPAPMWCAVLLSVTACAGAPTPAAAPASIASTPVTAATAGQAITPEGFSRSAAVVTEPDGTTCELCVWVADDATRRARGLMHVTDLGRASAMAFVYPSPHRGTFWMKDTPLPLSIAFFGPDGDYLDAFDMAPCDQGDACPRYRTPDDFVVAVEVPQGELAALGIVAGSRFELLDAPCSEVIG